ncbi:MAG: alpha-2-macroglobulin [Magnetococcales bacterium]|nr:alpha-2-macroglobulin [Magnetococcales bacterium]
MPNTNPLFPFVHSAFRDIRKGKPLSLLAIAVLIWCLVTGVAQAQDHKPDNPPPVQIENFTPQGLLKTNTRQVTVRYSQPMVPFGVSRQTTPPFAVNCPVAGQGRWLDSRNWLYEFDHDLPAGVRCIFTPRSELRGLDQQPVKGEPSYRFITGEPAILSYIPYQTVTEDQVFILAANTLLDRKSVQAHLYCDIPGIGERIGVRLLSGDELQTLLKVQGYFANSHLDKLMSGGRGPLYASRLPKNATPMDQWLAMATWDDSPIVAAQCQRRLPNDTGFDLVWDKGIRSKGEIESSKPQRLSFKVRSPFSATFECSRANKNAQCMPILPMTLHFSAPISREDALRIRLKGRNGTLYPSTLQRDLNDKKNTTDTQSWENQITLPGPFPVEETFTLEIPPTLRDDAGRALLNQDRFPLKVQTDPTPPLAKFSAPFGIIEAKGGAMLPVTLRNLESLLPLDPEHPGSEAREPDATSPVSPGSTPTPSVTDSGPEPSEVRGHWLRVDNPWEFVSWMSRVDKARSHKKEPDDNDGEGEAAQNAADDTPPHRPGEISVFESLKSDPQAKLETFSVPRPGGGKPFEVMGIPLPGPGYYVVELASDRLGASLHGENKPYYVPTAVLVTNLVAHYKRGESSSLVWVTTLDEGKPVAGAQVSITDCAGTPIHEASTNAEGVMILPNPVPLNKNPPQCENNAFVIVAKSGEDSTFTLSSWDKGIELHQFNLLTTDPLQTSTHFTTIFDRTLLRAGETVSMKHIARQLVAKGFAQPNLRDGPKQARIRHQGSEQIYALLPLEWDDHGVAVQSWSIPKEAKSGHYVVELISPTIPEAMIPISGSFRVDAFRVPTMKATIAPAPNDPTDSGRVSFDLQAHHLSGGAARQLPVQLRGMLQPKTIAFDDYEEFQFANGPVREGIEKPEGNAAADGEPEKGKNKILPVQSLILDNAGSARASFSGLAPTTTPQTLLAEMEFQDANGERVTASTQMTRLPSGIVLGIKTDNLHEGENRLKVQVVALNPQGKPMARVPVSVDLLQRLNFSHRKRLLGGYYDYVHHQEVKRVAEFCSGITNALGLIFCEGPVQVDGNVILQAKAVDAKNQPGYANTSLWVYKNEQVWFDVDHHNRMDVLPEKLEYDPGEEAVLQLRMPFREATVLITVEREGILESFTRTVTGENPTVRVPIRGHFAPNVFISALAVRGRVTGVEPTAVIDLGKPAFRLGYAKLKVGWKAHELTVKVSTDQSVCKIRDTVTATIQVTPPADRPLPADAELAVAVVDEGLLELKPNDSWNLLSAMMQKRPIQVETSTALEHVIGRRHFGRKSFRPGGSGGRLTMERQLLDTLLLWKGRVKLDPHGRAQVTIPVNDQLTSFRVVAVAHAGTDLFGTGATSFRTTQDLILHSALPPLVREQDRFQAGFTVRNSSARPLTIQVQATLSSPPIAGVATPPQLPSLPVIPMTLEPGASQMASWEVTVPLDIRQLNWRLAANAEGAEDHLSVSQEVIPVHPVNVMQAVVHSAEAKLEIPVRPPADALPNRGGVRLQVQDRLTQDLSGVREYMAAYPYTCLEQRVSKAVSLQDTNLWQQLASALPTYLDADGLAKFFPRLEHGSDALTSYLLAISHETGWTIPEETRKKMIEGLQKFVQGKISRRSPLPAADLNLRKLAALEAISRFQTVANEALSSLSIEPRHLPTSGVIDWLNLLNRTPTLPNRTQRLQDASQNLRNRLLWQGTTVSMANEPNDSLWWLLVSAETNLNRLLLGVLNDPAWKEDLPRLVRGTLTRQVKGHWASSPANAWGVVAMQQVAKRLESDTITGTSQAELAGHRLDFTWQTNPHGTTLDLPWPAPSDPQTLLFSHQGTGKPWVTLQSRAAIPLQKPMANGYTIQRTITPVVRKTEGVWSQGDVMRVRLECEAQNDMGWVVVNDPIPAGSAILGSGLGRDSVILDQGKNESESRRATFEERRFDGFLAYYEWIPKGRWRVEYTVRLNNPGTFNLPPARVEAMYAPEWFGATPLEPVVVQP